MKLLHIVAAGKRRGAELFASDLVSALGSQGFEQHVVLLRGGDLDTPFDAPTEHALIDHPLPAVRMDPRAIRTVRTSFTTHSPDVIQAHGGESLKYALAARGRVRTPVVYRRIGMSDGLGEKRLRRAAYGMLMRRARAIVAVANAVREETISLFNISPDSIVTIPNGTDARRFDRPEARIAVRSMLGIAEDAPVLLWGGALSAEKDPLAFVAVAAWVLERFPDTVALMAGDGPARDDVARAIGERGLGGRVQLLGSRGDIPDLLSAADVLVLPSRTEGMPGIAVEAGMSGLPVAAYDVGGVAEIVYNGVTGVLAPAGDLAALAQATASLVGDRARRHGMGKQAKQFCTQRFDINAIAPRYSALYDDVARAV